MVCQLVCVGVAVVVGGRGGEHLAVLMGGHRLGLPEVSSQVTKHKEGYVLTVRNDDKRAANDAEEGQERKRESGKEGGQRQVTGYRRPTTTTTTATNKQPNKSVSNHWTGGR